MSFNRVLPIPHPVYHDPATGRDYTRRSNSLLDHKIMTDLFAQNSSQGGEALSRRNSAASDHTGINGQASTVNSTQQNSRDEGGPSAASIERKRTASLMNINSLPVRGLSSAPSTPATSTPKPISGSTQVESSASSHFCLCQPDPKIPRPRNAFILYRQHYQGAVVAKHPGLANPDISKIIGEQWRQLPTETKNEWKNLAEEEKARHQQQYPEYRYRPRRYGRNNERDQSSITTVNGTSQCTRCGGRIMATPNTPATPFSPGFRSTPPTSAPPPTPARYHPGMGPQGPRSPGLPRLQRVPTGGFARRDIGQPLSPDAKRRRFNPPTPFQGARRERSPETPYPYGQRRMSSARPEYIQTPRTSVAMGPPPRPHRPSQTPGDPSLTLPPIQTAPSPSAPGPAKSVEGMVMSIPFINKIRLLTKITPPLAKPSPTSPSFPVRGGIIAIEGSNTELVKTMVTYLDSILAKTEDPVAAVKIFPGPVIDDGRNCNTTQDANAGGSSKMNDATVQYLDTIQTWHTISKNAAAFITTPTNKKSSKHTTPTSATATSPQSILPKTQDLSIKLPKPTSGPVPIALIPRYQLTSCDYHAIRIPIDDQYSPFDHWSWVATLWRGCVGPDMTIVVRECEKDEYDRAGGVEIRTDAGVLVVRLVKDKDGNLGFEDKVLRRLGFEVEEWVRAKREGKFNY